MTLRALPDAIPIPPKIPVLWAWLQPGEEARSTRRRSELVVLLLVSVQVRCATQYEMLSGLLWHQCHAVAELLKAVDMVTLDTSPILLVKIISSQVGIRFLGT